MVQKAQKSKSHNTVTKMGTSYQGELEAIRTGTTYAKENINISKENLHIFVDSQEAIQAIIEQNHQNYHDIAITEIRQNLINISHIIKSIKFVYCPTHKGIVENETADKLTVELSANGKEDGATQKIINIRT